MVNLATSRNSEHGGRLLSLNVGSPSIIRCGREASWPSRSVYWILAFYCRSATATKKPLVHPASRNTASAPELQQVPWAEQRRQVGRQSRKTARRSSQRILSRAESRGAVWL